MGRPYEHTKVIRQAKMKEQNRCQLCGSTEDVKGHHIRDYGFNGPATIDNIVVVCDLCHRKLHAGEIVIDVFDYSEND